MAAQRTTFELVKHRDFFSQKLHFLLQAFENAPGGIVLKPENLPPAVSFAGNVMLDSGPGEASA